MSTGLLHYKKKFPSTFKSSVVLIYWKWTVQAACKKYFQNSNFTTSNSGPSSFKFHEAFYWFRTFGKVCNTLNTTELPEAFCRLYFGDLPQHQLLFQICLTKMAKPTPLSLPVIPKLFPKLRANRQWIPAQPLERSSRLKGNIALVWEAVRTGRLKVGSFICLRLRFFPFYHKVYKTTIVSEVQRSFWAHNIRLYTFCFHLAGRYCLSKGDKPQNTPPTPEPPPTTATEFI